MEVLRNGGNAMRCLGVILAIGVGGWILVATGNTKVLVGIVIGAVGVLGWLATRSSTW